ncbi:putative RNA polymerase II subunit B1 CTD phosphatase RPAP2 isoform X2 [Lasioglossum baleicum]|uniref:putative RNA polymerase II subunit B1 CTD phosphatase RPAP2 isoform X2 n=1 Tax=Lasioglossum baleicum TaxID=434251 RepID=UPI003FCCA4A7
MNAKITLRLAKLVEQLLEPNIDVEWLLDNLQYMNKCHMEDVIEERAVIKLCGYVLCSNPLVVVINQKYHISTKQNKVYDVTRRKNFCSSRCYGACNYLLEQMLTSPLWLRDKEEIPKFKVLPAKDALQRSTPGDEVHLMDTAPIINPNSTNDLINHNETCKNSEETKITKTQNGKNSVAQADNQCDIINSNDQNINTTEINRDNKTSDLIEDQPLMNSIETCDHTKDKLTSSKHATNDTEQCVNDTTAQEPILQNDIALDDIKLQDRKEPQNNDKNWSKDNTEVQNELLNTLNTKTCNTTVVKENTVISNTKDVQNAEKNKSRKHKHKDRTKGKQLNEFYNLTINIEENIKEWVNEDTISLLSGDEEIKNKLLENVLQHDRYQRLCKKLSKLQFEDEKDDTDLMKNALKPMPHLAILQEEGKKMELKVKAFYKGNTVIEMPERTTETTEQYNDSSTVLPLTDAHAPKALRRRIFLDKLNRILPDLLRALAYSRVSQYMYNNEKNVLIKALVNTFSLTAKNIIFKATEWTLVGLIIIKMLSMIDPQLKKLLLTRQASMYISMILMSYKLDSNYLDRLIMDLTNVAKVVDTVV